ncbi:T4 RnlA family RNA ligase [Hymenobacter psoromatis]|uniref:T4 RnlA family RNA ligase n=1 Tax=Hymenobacter psoromatis TaxID=1484116 RepID=UPI001CBB2EEF|nr:T4 RnlA family RNA ligase [Hymenobacter psoromatis]
MPFASLWAGLQAARAAGLVTMRYDADTGRSLWCYTTRCVYEGSWDDITMLARGLVLHETHQLVVATPFPKFFNLGERGQIIPALPFEVFEKLDGSLIIIHYWQGQWRAVTKGAFDSAQAQWAEKRLAGQNLAALVPGTTYLAEAVYPENRIVIAYTEPALVLLAAYHADGQGLETPNLQHVAKQLGWPLAERHPYTSFAEMLAEVDTLPASREGFVVRFANDLRLKVKGAEYRRIHALISHCTPLALWASWSAGDDLTELRRELPEEFWADFDTIIALLRQRLANLIDRITEVATSVVQLTDKDLGLELTAYPADVRPFLFAWRKSGGQLAGKQREALFRAIRPAGNELVGYVPSYAIQRATEDL